MQSKSLSQTLLNNSQISGVELNTLDTNLSERAHGLYIESISKDRYADLRMCCDRPFWGHTHPLVMQYKFGNLSIDMASSANTSILSHEKKEEFLVGYKSIHLNEIQTLKEHNKVHLVLDEYSILDKSNLDLIEQLSKESELVIEEKDLTLSIDTNLFLTHKVEGKKILTFSFFEYSFCNFKTTSTQNLKAKALILSAVRYINFFLVGNESKLKVDQLVIDDFIKDNKNGLIRVGNYLQLPQSDLTISDFIKDGIFLNENNFHRGLIYLSIPASCTKAELLDTLDRILNILKR